MSQSLLARILLLSKFKCVASIYKCKSFISLALFNFPSALWCECTLPTNIRRYEEVKLRKGVKSCEKGKRKKQYAASTKSRIHFPSGRENSSDCNLESDAFPIAIQSCFISVQSHFSSSHAEGAERASTRLMWADKVRKPRLHLVCRLSLFFFPPIRTLWCKQAMKRRSWADSCELMTDWSAVINQRAGSLFNRSQSLWTLRTATRTAILGPQQSWLATNRPFGCLLDKNTHNFS